MAPYVEELLEYLSNGGKILVRVELNFFEVIIRAIGCCFEFKDDLVYSLSGPICSAVICYVMKCRFDMDHGVLSDTLHRLNELASEWNELEISQIFVKDFMPEARKFFTVPKVHQLSDNDQSLQPNEILAGFMDFLLQILNCEAYANSDEDQHLTLLRKELRFLLTFLADTPFRCTELEEVKILLREFEILANEAGSFIYSLAFYSHSEKNRRFHAHTHALLKTFGLLNVKIKEHCIKFSELPQCATHRANVVDSLFIVDSLLEVLESLMNREFNLAMDDSIHDQVKELYEELMSSRSSLTDIEVRQSIITDELEESLVEVRFLAYEAQYLINLYVVGNVPSWYLNLRLPAVVKKLRLIGTRLQGIKNISDTMLLKVMKDFSGETPSQSMETHMNVVDDVVVGFDDSRSMILGDLIRGSRDRKIISIFGMPGLGKTTTAHKLFTDRSIYGHFDRRAWCVGSESYQKRKVLTDILMSLLSDQPKQYILGMTEEILCVQIHQNLKGRRYLVVIDDVWYSSMLDDLLIYLPDDRNGSRVMITSRIMDTAPADSIFHSIPLLSEVQSWDLLAKKVFPDELCSPQLIDVGRRIAAKCHGLPLAVIVTSGILAILEKEITVWEKMEKELGKYILDGHNSCRKIMELSYEHLPDHLKPCFLYLGAFPEDITIPLRKLIPLWIAEGFIPKKERSPDDVAQDYLFDLINRSLVFVAERGYDGSVKACKMHDLLRDMCLRRANEENFLKSSEHSDSIYEKHHRLYVQSTSPIFRRPFGLHCRSLLGQYYNSFSDRPLKWSTLHPEMPLLRVMDQFPDEVLDGKMNEINHLVHLRYLNVGRMPKMICNLINLQYLSIHSGETIYIPAAILQMLKLRLLQIKDEAVFEENCGNSLTTNLKSLSFVRIYNDKDEEKLRCLPHLTKLKCICRRKPFPDLRFLTKLESLNMHYDYRPPEHESATMMYRRFLYGDSTVINFPPTIKKLTLCRLRLPWHRMSTIGELPNLHVLKLNNDAFVGEEWETVDGHFQELEFLKLEGSSLKQWTASSEHFPNLRCLVLSSCWELKKIPREFGDIPVLEKIDVRYCSYNASKSGVQIEEEQHENGNEELKVFISSHRWSKEKLVQDCRKQQSRRKVWT